MSLRALSRTTTDRLITVRAHQRSYNIRFYPPRRQAPCVPVGVQRPHVALAETARSSAPRSPARRDRRRCAYLQPLRGDFPAGSDITTTATASATVSRRDTCDADGVDGFAAVPNRVRATSALQCGISLWNWRRKQARAPPTGTRSPLRRC